MVFSRLMQTEPGFAPRGLETFLASVQETGTIPAARALLCHAAIAAAALIRSVEAVSPSGPRRIT